MAAGSAITSAVRSRGPTFRFLSPRPRRPTARNALPRRLERQGAGGERARADRHRLRRRSYPTALASITHRGPLLFHFERGLCPRNGFLGGGFGGGRSPP